MRMGVESYHSQLCTIFLENHRHTYDINPLQGPETSSAHPPQNPAASIAIPKYSLCHEGFRGLRASTPQQGMNVSSKFCRNIVSIRTHSQESAAVCHTRFSTLDGSYKKTRIAFLACARTATYVQNIFAGKVTGGSTTSLVW